MAVVVSIADGPRLSSLDFRCEFAIVRATSFEAFFNLFFLVAKPKNVVFRVTNVKVVEMDLSHKPLVHQIV